MKKNNAPRFNCQLTRKSLYLTMATISHLMLSATPALAEPAGGKIVGGGGSIDQSGLNTTIRQQTDRMAIDWQSFNVATDEKVKFIQPGSSSVALNRVLSHTGSEIHGKIEANGHILLVNPNGVFFGENSRIDVGGMIASGLHIDPNDFMNGEFTLTAIEGAEGKVINSGIINAATGGSVTLVGQQVKNEGLISAKLGAVNLAAGKEAVITFDASGLVGVRVTQEVLQDELGIDAAVINSGEINAEGGRILLSASTSQDIFSQAVNHGNLNSATSVAVHEDGSFTLGAGADVVNTGNLSVSSTSGSAGQIVLIGENITTSGNIHADAASTNVGQIELHSVDTTLITDSAKITAKATSAGKGGDVKILGNKVGLLDKAQINASGANGGGQILFGGDKTGNNIRIRNADFIYLSENSKVNTDAILNGNGGKLITFASDTARIYGELSARGGALGGNGGFVETSGLKSFEILQTPDVTAVQGTAGHWLIDPYDITIQAGGEIDKKVDEGFKFESGVGATTLDVGILESALEDGATVTVRTGAGGEGFGNINFATNLMYDFSGSATLILDAHNNIDLGIFSIEHSTKNLNPEGSLNVDFRAGGDIKFGSNAQVITYGGSFTASGVNFTLAQANTDEFFAINTSIDPAEEFNSASGGDIKLTMSGAISLGSSIRTDGGNFTVMNSSSFTNFTDFSNPSSHFDHAVIKTFGKFGGGDISITSSGNVDLGRVNFAHKADEFKEQNAVKSGSVFINTKGDVVLNQDIDFNNTEMFKVSESNPNDKDQSFLSINAGGGISILGNIEDSWGTDQRDTFDITLSSGGAIDVQGSIFTSGGKLIVEKSSSFTTTATAPAIDGKTQISTRGESKDDGTFSGYIEINSSGVVSLGTEINTNGGKVTINAGDAVTLNNINTEYEDDSNTKGALSISIANVTTESDPLPVVTQSASTTITAGDTSFDVGTGNVTLKGENDFTGNMTISSADTVDIKNSNPDGFNLGESNISGNLTLTAAGDITQFGKIEVAGTTDLSAGDNEIILGNLANNFGGKVTLTSAHKVTLADVDSLTIGTINTQGNASNRNGGNVNLTANGTITVDDINTSGLDGISGSRKGGNGGAVTISSTSGSVSLKKTQSSGGNGFSGGSRDNRAGGDAGEIEISGQKIILGGDLFSQGGQGRNDYPDGDGKGITLNGNIELTADITLGADVETEANTQKRGNIIIDGSVDSDSVAARNLTLTANNITFREHVGSIRLGDLNINAIGNVVAQSAGTEPVYKNITANTLNASATDFHIGNINTTAIATDTAGGNITISANNIRVGEINSSGSGTENGGVITISASGDDYAKIELAGDINSQSGNKINQGKVEVTLLSAGSVLLSHTNFFTSTVDITGSDGVDTLKGFDLDIESTGSRWSIDDVNSGNIGDGEGNFPRVNFTKIENLIGGDSKDEFTLVNTGSISRIDGGEGEGENTLTGRDENSTWEIDATNSLRFTDGDLYVTTFENINNLQGGSSADTFNIEAEFNGTLSGGIGADIFNINAAFNGAMSGGDDADVFNIEAAVVGDLSGDNGEDIFNIDAFVDGALLGGSGNDQFTFFSSGKAASVDGQGGSDTLTGRRDKRNTWTVSSDTRSLKETGSSSDYVAKFDGIETLQGGDLVDTFDITADFTGSLYGGGSADIFKLGADVTNAHGDAGNDKFIITTAGITASLDGGGDGDDSLTTSVDTTTNVWTISDVDAGSLVNGGTVNFEGIKRLNGSSGVDEFTVNALFSGVINGSDGADVFNLNADVGGGVNGDKGDDVFKIAATVSSPLNGGADDDRFNILASGVSVNINGGSDSNDTVKGFDDASNNNVWQLTNAFAGTLNNGGTINFSGIKTLEGGSGIDTLQGRSQANNWQIIGNDSGTLARQTRTPADTVNFSGIENITGGSLADHFTFGDLGIISGVLNGGDGAGGAGNRIIGRNTENRWDITDINAGAITDLTLDPAKPYVAGFENIQHLIGGSGADTFELLKGGHVTTINGGGDANDTLVADNLVNTWTLLTASSGTLESGNPIDYSLAFSEVENLTGNKKIDTFIFNFAGNYGGEIDAVGADNIVSIADDVKADIDVVLGNTLKGIKNANIIMGNGSGSITVKGADTDVHNWTISNLGGLIPEANGINDGAVSNGTDTIRFINFANLNGSDATDNFELSVGASITGTINGGLGDNQLTNRNSNTSWTLLGNRQGNLKNTPSNTIASFKNIQTIAGSGSDTLVGRNQANDWQITGDNSGYVQILTGSVDRIDFSGMNNLSGGTKADRFAFQDAGIIKGDVIGGDGVDTLAGRNTDNFWSINDNNQGNISNADTNASPYVKFFDIENLLGGSGADTFTFTSSGDITGVIDGGTHGELDAGDTLYLSSLDGEVHVELFESGTSHLHVLNMEQIIAPVATPQTNFLYGASNQPYTWTIDGPNSGTLVATENPLQSSVDFSNFGQLRGGINSDRFVITAGGITGTIHGGDGDGKDFADYSGTKAQVTIALGGDGSLGATGISGIEGVIGNNDGTSKKTYNSLISIAGGNNTWTIGNPETDGINDGQIAINGSTKPIFFENFNILNGGSGDDKFNLSAGGQFIGYINGGDGNNSFNAIASTVAQTVHANSSAIDVDGVAYVEGATQLFGFNTITANAGTESSLISNEKANTWDIQLNGENLLSVDGKNISFDGFSKLVGGADADSFYIHSLDNIPAVIDGGTGAADYVYFTSLSLAVGVTVGVGDVPVNTDLNIFRIEHLAGHDNATNNLISNGASDSWMVNGSNQGTLNSNLNFSGFANLTGGDGDDKFRIVGKDAALSGTMSGGAGDDSLSFTDRAATLELFAATLRDDNFNAVNFETINADGTDESFSNTLIAGNTRNNWTVNGVNAGTVNNDALTTTFKGFKNLIGGSGIDEFIFEGPGSLGGYIDGGSQPENGMDFVDLSRLSNADVSLGNSTYRDIEKIIGNGSSVLTSSEASTWNLLEENSGNVNNDLFSMAFEGFASLVGGEGNDQFNLTQGSLSGSVYGGDGNDTFTISGAVISGSVHGDDGNDIFEVSGATVNGSLFGDAGNDRFIATITAGNKGQARFVGGNGDDRLEAKGDIAGYSAQHRFNDTSGGLLRYTDEKDNDYDLSYSGINNIFDSVTADLLSVTTTSSADTLTLTDGAYLLNETINVSYNNKNNLTIAASSADEVIVSGAVNIPERLTIQGARVSAVDNNSLITADSLLLGGTAEVGTFTNRLNLNTKDLYVESANGAIYLQEQSGLNIAGFSTNALVDLSLDGDLTSSVALSSSQDISIKTSNGNIVLDKENDLNGSLDLTAANKITLRNITTTNLNNVNARELIVDSTGIINGVGLIQVGDRAFLESGGNINLANQNHNFNFLKIMSATNVSINNSDSLNLTGVSASGAVNINAQGINVNGLINAPSLMLNAGQGDAVLGGKVTVVGTANVMGRNITVDGDLLAANIQLDGSQGRVLINGRLNTESKESITVTANRVVQNGLVSAGTGVTVQAADSLTQNAAIMAGTDVSLSAGGTMVLADITATKGITISAAGSVDQNGVIVSSAGDIVIDSGRYNMNAGAALTADAGSVLLTSSGDLTAREISAATDVSLAAAGNAQILDQVTTTNGAISIQGGGVTLANNLIGNAGIEVVSVDGNIQQQAELTSAQGDIRVVANGDITMGTGSSTLSTNGSINYSGANLGITSFEALNTVTLAATRGAVTDLNGNDNNITAQRLVIDSATGIGSTDIIETLVDELSVSNDVGDIRLQNNKAVTVDRLRSNGNIIFNNLVGSVTLDNSEGTLFSRSETDARLAGGTMNANYDIGALTINIAAGDLIATGVADVQNPDIVARNAALIAPLGSIGAFARPLVVYVKDSLFIAGFNSWNPFWAFGVPPTTVDNASTIQGNLSDLLASGNEALVVVEALNEVDPAIFTNVRNYFYDDISILLPMDQLYYGD